MTQNFYLACCTTAFRRKVQLFMFWCLKVICPVCALHCFIRKRIEKPFCVVCVHLVLVFHCLVILESFTKPGMGRSSFRWSANVNTFLVGFASVFLRFPSSDLNSPFFSCVVSSHTCVQMLVFISREAFLDFPVYLAGERAFSSLIFLDSVNFSRFTELLLFIGREVRW